MDIEREQLENLISKRIPFFLLDLRVSNDEAPQFETAIRVGENSVVEVIQNKTKGLSDPIVLFCETGVVSEKAAVQLEAVGFFNLFVLKGGTRNFWTA